MNWLNEFLKDTKESLSFELPGKLAAELQLYITLLKEKMDEIKAIVYTELGIETMRKDAASYSEKVIKTEPAKFSQQGTKYRMEENNHNIKPPLSNLTENINERPNNIVVKYSIRMDQNHGEITLPEDTKDDDIERAILEDCGFHLTTKMSIGKAIVNQDSYVLTGFNSFASLFSKF